MFFSLTLPFVHVSLNVTNTSKYEYPFKEIGKFKSYYEQLIAMTDPEFLIAQENRNSFNFEEFDYNYKSNSVKNNKNLNSKIGSINVQQELVETKKSKITIAQLLFILYIIGAIVFLTRIVLLCRWIYKTISTNKVKYKNKIKLVEVNEKLPPFSFLNYVFLNKEIMNNNKANQILSHEEIHIKQKHSIDLLLSHLLTVFHWFNPLAWLLHKAIKTNHEYIADSEVVNKGHDLLDYQVLLLNQFITIPSVELVNNFNLISIKNRIAMMNKIKSGFIAKLKAFLIIPFALLTFLLFANLTVTGPEMVLKNFSFLENQSNISQVNGIWKNNSKDTYGHLIKFDDNKFSVLDNQAILKEYQYIIKDNYIVLKDPNGEPIKLKFQITSNEIKIWWNNLEVSEYTKTEHKNSLDIFLADKGLNINPPTIKNYNIITRPELLLFIGMDDKKIVVQNKVIKFADVEKSIIDEKLKFNQLDLNNIIIQLAVDEKTPMKKIYDLYQILRKQNLLNILHLGYCDNNSSLISKYIGFTHKIPPLDGLKLADKKDLSEMGIKYFEIDATNDINSIKNIEYKLTNHISESEKYISSLMYNNSTPYVNYINYMDMVWTVVLDFRNKYALEKFNAEYKTLDNNLQKLVKRKYPIILTQVNTEEDK